MQWKLKMNIFLNENVEQDLLIREDPIWDFPFYLYSWGDLLDPDTLNYRFTISP